MKASKARLSRRNFLLTVGAGTAAGAAALVAKPGAPGGSQDKSIESKKGYQLTEHVRNYYRTAKI
ncbi:MAG TPA: twin-arginine translocation signal domain-containing protein [Burkholderiales bacterium]|nr:twin-arginine translocation signal domain-containing protein [Burkholderiales bacterium]